MLIRFFAYLLSAAACAPALEQVERDSACGTYLCVNVMTAPSGNPVWHLVEVAVRQKPLGWVSLGFGHHMRDSHMIIMWRNDDDSVTISQRYATGHTEPYPDMSPAQLAIQVEPSALMLKKAKTKNVNNEAIFAFELLPSSTGQIYNTTNILWAYSKTNPDSRDPGATLVGHYVAGFLTLNFAESTDVPVQIEAKTPSLSHTRIVVAHGVLLTFGFMVILPFGVLAARLSRTFTSRWFQAHYVLNYLVGLPVILLGWLLGPIAVFDAQAYHFMDAHQIGGIIILVLYILQIILGKYIHARKVGQTCAKAHPPSNILHATFGLVLLLLVYSQIRSGLYEWYTVADARRSTLKSYLRALNVWSLSLLVIYLIGLMLLRRQFKQENVTTVYQSVRTDSELCLIRDNNESNNKERP